VIGKLHEGIASLFSEDSAAFSAELSTKIATQYAFIIAKGFKVILNDINVLPRPTELVFSLPGKLKKASIQPFIYQGVIDGVSIFLAIGFTRSIPSQEEIEDEQENKKRSSMGAGWSIICNDRAVVYCDKTELTGWGEANVPSFHNQYIAISGVVEFSCADASKLPTTTTKRGIDASSTLYLRVKNKMREAMIIFTQFTNKWKKEVALAKRYIENERVLPFAQIKNEIKNISMSAVTKIGGKQYRPNLPLPKEDKESSESTISFKKSIVEIEIVSKYLFNDTSIHPSKVGEQCFDLMLKEASK